jgi:hypothetical protein
MSQGYIVAKKGCHWLNDLTTKPLKNLPYPLGMDGMPLGRMHQMPHTNLKNLLDHHMHAMAF